MLVRRSLSIFSSLRPLGFCTEIHSRGAMGELEIDCWVVNVVSSTSSSEVRFSSHSSTVVCGFLLFCSYLVQAWSLWLTCWFGASSVSRILHLVLTIWSPQPMIGTTPSGCLLCVIPPFHLHSPQDQSPTPQLWQHRSLQSLAWLFPSRDSSSVGVPALIRGQRCGLQRM